MISDKVSKEDLQYLIDHNYTAKDLEPYRKVKGYQIQNLEAYYQTLIIITKTIIMQYVITNYPFLISSNGEPKESYTITNPDDLLVLVKKRFLFTRKL